MDTSSSWFVKNLPCTDHEPLFFHLVVSDFFRHFLRSSRLVPQSPPFLRVGILYHTINLPPFMIVWQILRNREASGFTNSRQWQYL